VLHSIILPCRNRHDSLELCLRSIKASADNCATIDWEAIVVDDSSRSEDEETYKAGGFSFTWPLISGGYQRRHYDIKQEQYFNKPKLLNIGISHAAGDILTFLDADAIVAPRFMENAQRLVDNPALTKLCYRVRHLAAGDVEPFRAASDPLSALQELFATYGDKRIRYEAYGRPDRGSWKKPRQPIFGNSQFSIRREVLGDLRYDERFAGRGYEDIYFNFLIWKTHYDTYNAEIVTDAEHAMYHVENPPSSNDAWGPAELNLLNERLYKREFGAWFRNMKAKGIEI
jgi:glycosyltransferase involved in cell wall biosynthesis